MTESMTAFGLLVCIVVIVVALIYFNDRLDGDE